MGYTSAGRRCGWVGNSPATLACAAGSILRRTGEVSRRSVSMRSSWSKPHPQTRGARTDVLGCQDAQTPSHFRKQQPFRKNRTCNFYTSTCGSPYSYFPIAGSKRSFRVEAWQSQNMPAWGHTDKLPISSRQLTKINLREG